MSEPLTAPCGPGCAGHPVVPAGWTSWQEALHSDDDLAFARWRYTEPPLRAGTLGHTVEWDATFLGGGRGRWTCTKCGGAVLIYENNIYGSAVKERCDAR